MLEEEKIVNIESTEIEQDTTNQAIDKEMEQYELTESTKDLATQIMEAPTQGALQQCLDAFNLNQNKKNALRVLKLNSLLDKVEDQAIERFNKRPDQISNKELLDYMQVVSSQVERSQKAVDVLSTKPAIQINNQKNEVNVNIGAGLDKESKERVIEAVQALLQQAKTQRSEDSENIIDAVPVEENCIIEEAEPIDTTSILEEDSETDE